VNEDVVAAARAWIGTPYRHRASVLGAGCDCLGLLRGVWRKLYGAELEAVPNYRADGRDAGDLAAGFSRHLIGVPGSPAPGLVVLFRLGRQPVGRHCGIMATATRFVHAQERLGVVEGNLTEGWARRVVGVFAFPSLTPSTRAQPSGH
jgi:NlpC/P60 family putative phage cell wall peptidase